MGEKQKMKQERKRKVKKVETKEDEVIKDKGGKRREGEGSKNKTR